MIFNKQGSLIKKLKFYYNNKLIQNTKEYKYLGFTFSCSGLDNAGIQTLLNQAKKAWYTIQQSLSKSINKNLQTYLHLFDTQVKPIMLYACEAWSDSIKNEDNITNILRKNPLEKFHVSVLKRLLGTHRKTSNISVLLETGRHPITMYTHEQAIKYFLRLPLTNPQSLLNIFYNKEKETVPYNDTFIKYVTNNLNKIGMTFIWVEQLIYDKTFHNDAKLLTDIKTRLKDTSSQKIIDSLVTNPGKLTFLKQIKNRHNLESYLNIKNFEHRRAITRIRTSSHRLEIETGRWHGVDRNLRICKNCILGEVEDENHFLFECQMHSSDRMELINTIKDKINVDISRNVPHEEKLKYIFFSEDLAVLNALGKFAQNAFKKRDTTSLYVLPPHYVYYGKQT